MDKISDIFSFLIAVLIPVSLIYYFLNAIDGHFYLTIRAKDVLSSYIPWLHIEFLWWVLWAGLFFQLWKYFQKKDMTAYQNRICRISYVITPTILLLFIVHLSVTSIFGSSKDPQPLEKDHSQKHVVMLVLDGFPLKLLSEVNGESYRKKGYSFFKDALEFSNLHTNIPRTFSYFGSLYAGRLYYAYHYEKRNLLFKLLRPPSHHEKNLISVLQREGVKYRSFHFHRLGFPEGCSSHNSYYKGLRSIFLTTKHASILNALGLQYGMVFPGPLKITYRENDRRAYVLSRLLPFLTPEINNENFLTNFVLPQMEDIHRFADKTFLIIHIKWKMLSGKTIFVDGVPAVLDSKAKSLRDKIPLTDFRYKPEAESYVRQLRKESKSAMTHLQERISNFVGILRKKGLLKDTLLIVTADHGSVYSKGRLAYAFHPQEEVMRVPLFIFGSEKKGVDRRFFGTIDLTRTILDYFNIGEKLSERSFSLFKEKKKPFVISGTQISDVFKEWFIIIYKDGCKYIFNIHAKGDGLCVKKQLDRFETQMIARGPQVLEEVKEEVETAFQKFDIYRFPKSYIHPNFHSLMDKKKG